MSKSSISYVFETVNETNNNIEMKISKNLSSPIIGKDESQDYSLSVTRLTVPTSLVEVLYFTDISKFKTCLKMFNNVSNTYENYFSSMPNEASHNILYYTKEQIIEYLNRSLCKNYFSYLEDSNSDVFPTTSSVTETIAAGSTGSNTNIANIAGYNNIAGVKLLLTSASLVSGNANQLVRLFIQSPSGSKQYVYVGPMSDILNHSAFTFNEHSYYNFESNFDSKSTDVKFYESYLKHTGTPHGNWTIGLESPTACSINFNYKLSVYRSDATNVPYQQPFVSRVGGEMRYNYQTIYAYNNHRVGFSPFLFNSLAFTLASSSEEIGSDRFIFLNYDGTLLDTDLSELVILSQEMSTLNAIGNLNEVQIRSNSLSSIGENLISNSNIPISSNVLAEFVVDRDNMLGNSLIYSISERPWRLSPCSAFLHSLKQIDFSIFLSYDNGLTKQLLLSPGEQCTVRVSLLKNV